MTLEIHIDVEDKTKCEEYLENSGIVAAIKHVRSVTGAGLKEAKYWVDNNCVMNTNIDGVVWRYKKDTVEGLLSELLELTAKIADVHRRLDKLGAV